MCHFIDICLYLAVILSPSRSLTTIIFFSCQHTYSLHNLYWFHIINWANTLNKMSQPTDTSLCLFVILSPSCSLISIFCLSVQHTCSSFNSNWCQIILWSNTLDNLCHPTNIPMCAFIIRDNYG
jgi:hypothetical protein